ncbi:hypothetical protein [Enteractinococcus helveticum]|uniref:hypothetical protein n=1 Tax=Enteractinococcus helveticum TaxID=1837282 RepID=UPI0012378B55|nr:hypothetical protein [Enteractinococcus helveticum]
MGHESFQGEVGGSGALMGVPGFLPGPEPFGALVWPSIGQGAAMLEEVLILLIPVVKFGQPLGRGIQVFVIN